ncbi:MAG: PAS domain S-box protein, partial [Verrucomicrobiota bacterium]
MAKPSTDMILAPSVVSRDRWWRCLFEESEDAQVVCTSDGMVVEFNRRAAQLLDLQGQYHFNLHRALTGSTSLKLATLLKRTSGGQTVLSSVTLMCGGQLTLIADLAVTQFGDDHSLVAIKDASRRWRMESHVQRLITAVDATPDVVFLTDSEYRLIFVNPAFQIVTGHTIEDALGRTADFLRAPSEKSKIESYLAQIAAGSDWQGEMLNVRHDGSTYPVAATISPIFDKNGGFLGYVSFERDVSQTQKLQHDLRLEHNYALSIINSLDSALYTTDREFRLSHVNDGWKKMPMTHGFLHLTEPPQAGRPLLDYVPDPEKRSELLSIFKSVLSEGKPREIRSSSSAGQHWLIKIAPWQQEGENLGILYVVTDQTQFHELQKQLFQAQKMETIGALAAGVAHDFNNLLQAIRGNVSLLLLDNQLSETMRLPLEHIDQAANRAEDITKQLLSFSRNSEEQETVLDFNQVARDITQLLKRSSRNKIEIRQLLTDTPLKVRIDATRAQQLLLNLCVNAQDAMPNGGLLIITSSLTPLTAVQGAKVNQPEGTNFVRCSVADTGTGIPPEVMPRIFDPFYTTKEKGKGTGLGLSIVHSVITRAGGFIEVDSTPGEGTAFHVYLPLVQSGMTNQPVVTRGRLVKGTGRVLVVDDVDLVLDFTRNFLKAAGYEVFVAKNADEALEL